MADRFGAAQPIADAMGGLPRSIIEGLLGQGLGQKLEGWLGMPLDATGATSVAHPDTGYQQQMLERANQGFRDRAAQQPAQPRRGFPQR